MCLAVPSKIISINKETALIDVYGARKEISLKMLAETPNIGDFVLVHAGFAIQKIAADSVHSGEYMHESSLAINIIDIAQEQCRERGCKSVDSVTVRLGKASGVLPESLEFAFNAVKTDTIASNAKLVFEIIPVGGTCSTCHKEFESQKEPYVLACPHCGSTTFELTKGREMEIVSMEIN
jgi:hydrogenase nickel incorporation protein HypA/HybF